MACADAIWRLLIQATAGRPFEINSFIHHISIIRPRETGKIESKPGFRRMHEAIEHVGLVSRLDCWHLEAERRGFESLEAFAQSEPSWEMLNNMAVSLVQEQVADNNFSNLRAQPLALRDQVRENVLLRQQYFLLYEEITYALNEGDIGRVEDTFMPWAFIFRGCGKHKYAAHMMKYLHNVHFIYPEGLKRAICMNILCNPTGTPGQFRAIDWWVEHNNLYLKRIYGGKYSNHTKHKMLADSPLIELYKNTRIQVENIFHLYHRTTRHSTPNLEIMFSMLHADMRKNNTNRYIAGRTTSHSVPDAMCEGLHVLSTTVQQRSLGVDDVDVGGADDDKEGWEDVPDEENIELEVGDDGSLDV
ncbi:hypothetical protein HWV62_25563 [Athelia sp. TMB]|nr:hypothetical protein HWV62_25563 [Athelia sp. TMB]